MTEEKNIVEIKFNLRNAIKNEEHKIHCRYITGGLLPVVYKGYNIVEYSFTKNMLESARADINENKVRLPLEKGEGIIRENLTHLLFKLFTKDRYSVIEVLRHFYLDGISLGDYLNLTSERKRYVHKADLLYEGYKYNIFFTLEKPFYHEEKELVTYYIQWDEVCKDIKDIPHHFYLGEEHNGCSLRAIEDNILKRTGRKCHIEYTRFIDYNKKDVLGNDKKTSLRIQDYFTYTEFAKGL